MAWTDERSGVDHQHAQDTYLSREGGTITGDLEFDNTTRRVWWDMNGDGEGYLFAEDDGVGFYLTNLSGGGGTVRMAKLTPNGLELEDKNGRTATLNRVDLANLTNGTNADALHTHP
jgi:hypothetical protein